MVDADHDGPKNIWFEDEDDTKPTASELYQKVHNENYMKVDGRHIYFFPQSDTKHYGYGVEFYPNPYGGSMMEEVLYKIFKRTDGELINENKDNTATDLQTNRVNVVKKEIKHKQSKLLFIVCVVMCVCVFGLSVKMLFY